MLLFFLIAAAQRSSSYTGSGPAAKNSRIIISFTVPTFVGSVPTEKARKYFHADKDVIYLHNHITLAIYF